MAIFSEEALHKRPPDNNLINPTTLSNSIRMAALSSSNVVVNTSRRTNYTSSPAELEAIRRERLLVILNFAIVVIESDDFDPIEPNIITPQSPQQ
jgi:hypothetical protein